MHSSTEHLTTRLVACCALATLALLIGGVGTSRASVTTALTDLQTSGKIDADKAKAARKTYLAARSLRKKLKGARQLPLTNQLRTLESLARKNRITGDRVTPLFSQLQVNVDWFRTKNPAAVGTRSRFGDSRIYYQYFAGWGWQFHPLANFSQLNAIWTDKSAAARRALSAYAKELISFGVLRGGALTWEYYFPFSGSPAPFISSISQGTAVQSLARSGNALADPEITAAATRAARAFTVSAPTGLKVSRDGGYYFAGYSGNRSEFIFNMFAQALDGLHDYAKITGDTASMAVFEKGLITARRQMPKTDTGAWSYYELGGAESNLNYHQVLVEFLARLCEDTSDEAVFCDLHDRLSSYLTQKPTISKISKKTRSGRIYVTFMLSKVSTVTVKVAGGGSATATVARGKRVFSVKKARSSAVTITVKDLAGNSAQYSK
ncbi:MAG: D-glucuronyl C5-epimerase family protein [Solirubrobacterales bacterium]